MRNPLTALLASLLAAAATAGVAVADRGGPDQSRGGDDRARTSSIGLWGDMPYNDAQKTAGVPALISDMNSQRLAFTAHDGDLKAGSGPCPDSLYTDALARFDSLEAPAIFTPGDNDWTDCDRNPGVDSAERLAFERKVLFATPLSMGQHPLRQEVQAPPYVENRRWTVGGVVYATLNVQGSCNNLCDTAPDPAEQTARNAADIEWLNETFDEAEQHRAAAVMVIFQADPGWDLTDGPARRRAIPRRSPRPTAPPTATSSSSRRCVTGPWPSAGRSRPSTGTRTTSASTSRCWTRPGGACRTSRAWRPSATTRRTTTTTCNG
jgi:hypothetical protein